MARSADAIIKPELLVWGRKTIGYDLDEAAKKIGVDPERLAKWEKGDKEDRPTVKKLFKIANVYKRPFAAFYFSSPPTHWDEPYDKLEDWRTLPDTEYAKKSTGLVLELREAARRREILLDLAEEMGDVIRDFDLSRSHDESPASLAHRVRKVLGRSIEDQKACSDSRDALRMWRTAVEENGVLVFQTGFFNRNSVQMREMRGAALYFDQLPIIIMNSKDSVTARIFTIMHELGHLILRQSGLSNFRVHHELVVEEVFCNEFAGELLVPSFDLLSELEVRNHTHSTWEDKELGKLATQYKVSKAVILRRLLENDRTTISHYKRTLEKWREEWEIENESTAGTSSGGPDFHTKFVRCHGSRFVSSVLDAYDEEFINSSQLSEYLGSKLKHIENIRDDLAKVLA